MAQGMAPAAGESVHLLGLGPILPDAPARQSADSKRRFDSAVDVDGLIEVQHAVRTPAQGVDQVMGVLRAKAGQDDAALGSLGDFSFRAGSLSDRTGEPGCVSARSGKVKEPGAFGDITTAAARRKAGGNKE